MGQSRRLGESRIQHDELAPLPHSGHQIHGVGCDQRLKAIGAGHDDILAVQQVRVGHLSEGVHECPVDADKAVGFVGDDIEGTEDACKTVDE